MNAKVIAIAMRKGGVSKTTTCANLGIGIEWQVIWGIGMENYLISISY